MKPISAFAISLCFAGVVFSLPGLNAQPWRGAQCRAMMPRPNTTITGKTEDELHYQRGSLPTIH